MTPHTRPPSSVPGAAESIDVATPIGVLLDIAGASSRLLLDLPSLQALATDPDDPAGQVGQVGSLVTMQVGRMWIVAAIRSIRLADDGINLVADVDLMGEAYRPEPTQGLRGFRRGVTRYPLPGSPVYPVSRDALRQIYAKQDRPHITVGRVHMAPDMRAAVYVDALLGKHFALVGSTGTGKSTSTALILHRICENSPHGHIVVIDPHGEYAAAFVGIGELLDVSNLQLPYWLLNFQEHCDILLSPDGAARQVEADILARCLLAAKGKSRMAQDVARLTVDTPIPYLLTDLSNIVQAEMSRLDRASDNAPFLRLKARIEELRGDPRYAFMFSGMLVADTMAAFVRRVFRFPAQGKPISIIDVSGVPSEITSVVVAVLSRLVFDFALWSRGEASRPVLLVCEEAHRYVPNERSGANSAAANILGRIAKEGRKYGVSLGLITQRPSDLAEGVLSQCGTILTMRLNNERDQAFVRAAMPEDARGFLDAIPALRNRECIIVGEGVTTPIRVAFDPLEAERRPASGSPSFTSLWQESGGEEAMVERTIRRWRTGR
ncbi:ATP-binding protein [Sphingomonas sp. Leaf10]|uniref:ATP-binding protein n=1 Tax=Sphingomonas sp. Leaf10 TaxID=1735676 RepID=UPI0006F9C77C|nr:ATP-binding protein [Sphingomonas sp. Leaf10]KQM32655.1 ATPase [Sphingomonas sp. Leaf10]